MNINKKKECAKLKFADGFMMVEAVVAVAIISVSILAAMLVAQKSTQLSQRSLHVAQATYLLEEGAEAARIMRDNDWDTIDLATVNTDYCLSFSGGTWNMILSSSDSTNCIYGSFNRTVRFFDVNRDSVTGDIASSGTRDQGTRLVTVSVSWNEGGQEVVKQLSFYLMNVFS